MNWMYFVNGGGHWMSRWLCTDRDVALMLASVVSCLLMFFSYLYYSRQQSVRERGVAGVHNRKLRSVFFVCGFIHIVSSVVVWWQPLHWLVVLMMLG